MHRNPYWPLNGPSFLSVLQFRRFFLSRWIKIDVGFGSNFAARMASRSLDRRVRHPYPLPTHVVIVGEARRCSKNRLVAVPLDHKHSSGFANLLGRLSN